MLIEGQFTQCILGGTKLLKQKDFSWLCFPPYSFHLSQTRSLHPMKSHASACYHSSSDKVSSVLGELITTEPLEETKTQWGSWWGWLSAPGKSQCFRAFRGPHKHLITRQVLSWQMTSRPSRQEASQDYMVSEWPSWSESQFNWLLAKGTCHSIIVAGDCILFLNKI